MLITTIASLLLGIAALITSLATLISALRGREEVVIAERLEQRREPGGDNQLALPF